MAALSGRARSGGANAARVTFGRALRSEIVRLRRSPLVWLHAVLGACLGGLAGAYFALSAWDSLMGTDAFFQLLGAGAPLLAGISCGLAADAEQRAGDGANLLGASSRRSALAAKLVALLGLGLAAVLFCAALALAGRELPAASAVALAVVGIAAGSACSYAIFLWLALKLGRNAAIGMGALGFVAAMALLGGLANGLVTGTLSGGAGIDVAAWIPFAWPSRLATLPLEASIAAGMGAQAQAQAFAAAYVAVGGVCVAATAAVGATALALANRFEGRRGGE